MTGNRLGTRNCNPGSTTDLLGNLGPVTSPPCASVFPFVEKGTMIPTPSATAQRISLDRQRQDAEMKPIPTLEGQNNVCVCGEVGLRAEVGCLEGLEALWPIWIGVEWG